MRGERQIAAAGEAMQHGREGALPAFFAQDRAPCRRRSRASGSPAAVRFRAPPRCAGGSSAPARRAGCCRSDSRARPRRSPRSSGAAASAISVLASMSSSSCALCGWVPTEQNTSGNCSAIASTCGMLLHPGRDRHHAADAGRARARHHGVEFGGKIGKIEVAMAVDQHVSGLFASGFDVARETPAPAPAASRRP